MTKQEILTVFAKARVFLTPDEVQKRIRTSPDRRSLYSYLLRLARQGLLKANNVNQRGRLAYCLTERGQERLEYFRQQ